MATDDQNSARSTNSREGRRPGRVRLPEPVRISAAVLERHRARVLDPAVAAVQPGSPRPEETAYRVDTLLIPLRFAIGPELQRYNEVLRSLGVRLRVVIPQTQAWQAALRVLHPELPIPVLLEPREDVISDRAPDPWAALVALRRSLDAKLIRGVGLEHLVLAATTEMEGAPVSHGQPVGGPDDEGIALYSGSRSPVRVFVPAPARRAACALPAGRRPVVAMLDTGIGSHPWLEIGDIPADPVVEVSQSFQDLLADHEKAIAAAAGVPMLALNSPMEQADVVEPLLGLVDSHAGHGTFAAGLVYQNCPDSRVLALRVMHTDGATTEGSVLLALEWLRLRVEAALNNQASDELVDVVSLSLGFYPETAQPDKVQHLAEAIGRLTDLGVLVVAAAGNQATTRPFLPAALEPATLGAEKGGEHRLVAVGALNAAGDTVAAFSNEGPWVHRWAPGNALVSTVPMDFQGTASPSLEAHNGRLRTNTDPDDLRTGFAVWAGTSFATPVIAGLLAAALVQDENAVKGGDEAEQHRARADRALLATDELLGERGWL